MTLILECPGCGRRIAYSADNPHRPFCSGRCKDADFIGWAEEKNAIPGERDPTDFTVEPAD